MKKLSIYVDESGDFGPYSAKEPFYLLTFVFIKENDKNNKYIQNLNAEIVLLNYGTPVFHAGPIIRKEKDYALLSIEQRRRLFNKMSFFANNLHYLYATFFIDRKVNSNDKTLTQELLKQLNAFLLENLYYFQGFDLIIYYDNGQKQIKTILKIAFSSIFTNIIFSIVLSKESRLLQLADYLTTLELIKEKFIAKIVTKSEIYFFGSFYNFKRNYYHPIEKKKFNT